MNAAEAIVFGVQIWGSFGIVVALLFLTIGIDRIDEDARGAYVFRPLLIPGVLLIWPLVLWRWWQIETEAAPWLARYRPVRKSYGLAVILMSLAIVFALAAGLSVRQSWPADIAPEQISEAGQ